MPVTVAYVLGAIAALAGTIAAFIMIVPDKKREGLNKFFKWLHDYFNFKSLWIEKILKFLFIFQTLGCIAIGFFMLFSVQYSFYGGGQYMGLTGILLIILGPVVNRLIYEFVMMAVLMVKNTIEINNKLVPQEGSVADKKAKEDAEKAEKAAAQAQYQQQFAQQQYAQPQYNQPQYGQPQYGQQQYAQPQYQQPPYEQPAQAPDQNKQQ